MTAAHSPARPSGEATPGPAGEGGFAQRARGAVRARELALDLARVRKLSRFGPPVWAGFAVYDVLQARRPEVGHLGELLAFRAAGTLLLLLLALWVRYSASTTRFRLELRMTLAGVALSLCLSLMSLYDGGFTSLYSPGIVLVMFSLASVPRPLRRGLRLNTLMVLPFPLVMCAAALLSPAHAALLREPGAITAAVQFHFTVLATGSFVALLGHALWSMRRELLAHRSLGGYQLTRPLGQGSLGEVWAGHHLGLRRDVAIKVLHRSDGLDAAAAQRFEQTMQALSALTHPNAVRIHDFGFSDDGHSYYVMELLAGETLQALVAREHKQSLARATRFVLQIARALAEAHGRGIVHHNLKAENVLVTRTCADGESVKVLDLGLAPPAPCAWGGVDATPAADVYALGAIFFLLLTGEPVVKDELLGAEHARAPSPSARLGAALPDRIESIVVRCLEHDPSERFANARELLVALEACLPLVERGEPGLRALPEALARGRALRSNDAQPADEETRVDDQEELARLLELGPLAADDTETALSR